tara:strand:- start:124 stop:306 length:183 start_codon:yes stop_codon:yes gene_type:complete
VELGVAVTKKVCGISANLLDARVEAEICEVFLFFALRQLVQDISADAVMTVAAHGFVARR